MARARLVDVVDHRRDGGRLSVRAGPAMTQETGSASASRRKTSGQPSSVSDGTRAGRDERQPRCRSASRSSSRESARCPCMRPRNRARVGREPRALRRRDQLEKHLLELLRWHGSLAERDELPANSRDRRLAGQRDADRSRRASRAPRRARRWQGTQLGLPRLLGGCTGFGRPAPRSSAGDSANCLRALERDLLRAYELASDSSRRTTPRTLLAREGPKLLRDCPSRTAPRSSRRPR